MLDAGAFGTEDFFFDAANSEYAAGQGEFAGHCNLRFYRALRVERCQRGENSDACARPVLRHCAFGEVEAEVKLLKHPVTYTKRVLIGAEIVDGDFCRFLHHFAEIAGDIESACAVAEEGFDVEKFAARRRPRQTRDDARLVSLKIFVVIVFGDAESLANIVGRDGGRVRFVGGNLDGGLAGEGRKDVAEFAHARFAGVTVNQQLQRVVGHNEVFGFQSVVGENFWDEMAAGNLDFFLRHVARHLYQLHTVEESVGNFGDVVGSCNKHHLRQIVVEVKKIVVELRVLFGIQNLQHCRRRVAPETRINLVYLVQHKNRI